MDAASTEFFLRRLRQEKERVRLAVSQQAREAHRVLAVRYAHKALAGLRDADDSVSFETFGIAQDERP